MAYIGYSPIADLKQICDRLLHIYFKQKQRIDNKPKLNFVEDFLPFSHTRDGKGCLPSLFPIFAFFFFSYVLDVIDNTAALILFYPFLV